MREIRPFARRFFDPEERLFRIGGGGVGGKALGLLRAAEVLRGQGGALAAAGLAVDVPSLVVLGTEFFERFVEANRLAYLLDEEPDDRRVAEAFHRAAIPAELVGDLRALAELVKVPLAVRSSSQLEDALGQPFAGVYGTKMIPSNAPDAERRFRGLLDAVKFVWASTWFVEARAYLASTTHRGERERMAVLLQEVVGRRHGERFYPEVSGVARSYNFYPTGGARPEEGVLDLALGLGKTIVDGGLCWTVSPARPRVAPPFATARERLDGTQNRFWAIQVGAPPPYDPMAETEHLVHCELAIAEADGALDRLASTYDAASDRIWPGLGRQGARVVDFAPILVHRELPLVETVRPLLAACEAELGAPVEIEFALTLPPREPPRFGLLQVRPLLVSEEQVEVPESALAAPGLLLGSHAALGNGRRVLEDVLYVDPERFEARATPEIAREIEEHNRRIAATGRPYLLIGFGRWGSSDPWLGIPVRWDQISGARAVIEASLPGMSPEPSQGSHFFHNLSSFGVLYLTVTPQEPGGIDWAALAARPEVASTPHVRHVRCAPPLAAEVDGRSRRGLVRFAEVPS
jgi:hypothetical protein